MHKHSGKDFILSLVYDNEKMSALRREVLLFLETKVER